MNYDDFIIKWYQIFIRLKEKKAKERERAEMKVFDAAKAHQLAAVNAAVKFEIKDMQLPAITIEGNNTNQVRIPKFGDNEEIENGKWDI